MGSTYVDFGGKGFEADDSTLEVWLHLLVEEIDKLDKVPDWLQEMRDEWELQSTAGFGFGVMPGLDRFIADSTRKAVLLDLCARAMTRLEKFGDTVPRTALNAMGTGDGAVFTSDVPTRAFLQTGKYFVRLLEGKLGSDRNDARLWIKN